MTRMPEPLSTQDRRALSRRDDVPPAAPRPTAVDWARFAAGGHVVALVLAIALEPAPTGSPEAWAWVGALLSGALLAGIGIALATTRTPRRSTVASLVAGVAAVAITVGCPATGHHALGAWWVGQLAVAGAAAGLAAYAYRKVR